MRKIEQTTSPTPQQMQNRAVRKQRFATLKNTILRVVGENDELSMTEIEERVRSTIPTDTIYEPGEIRNAVWRLVTATYLKINAIGKVSWSSIYKYEQKYE